MRLRKLQQLLEAEILAGEEKLDMEVDHACGSDLMSDVLAYTTPKAVLLTGLTNPQTVRTAEMIDLTAIVFVRGKRPPDQVVELAEEKGIPIFLTHLPLYEACGILYQAGLGGCARRESGDEFPGKQQ